MNPIKLSLHLFSGYIRACYQKRVVPFFSDNPFNNIDVTAYLNFSNQVYTGF
jgi:hypothetical protein